jgi:spermidine synthase
MGATMPLASAVCQRTLGQPDSRALGFLFGVNTLGAAVGGLIAGYLMVPVLGISSSLYCAVVLNIVAAVIFAGAGLGAPREAVEAVAGIPRGGAIGLSLGNPLWAPALTMLLLGFCSLGYEMALLRLFALERGPLPSTFAFVITGFLLSWSVGAALSSRAKVPDLARGFRACGALLLLSLASYYLWWYSAGSGIQDGPPMPVLYGLLRRLLATACFLPCVMFGFLFGAVIARAARVWGRDVGRLYAANTAGAVAGATAIPLVGFELPFPVLVAGLAAMMLLLQYSGSRSPGERPARRRSPRAILTAIGVVALVVAGWAANARLEAGISLWFGRAGVLGLDREGNLSWDGLWHSRLADRESYIGTNNWALAALPAVSYSGPAIRDVCVVGLGTGITAAVIARLATVRQVDVYEINRDLEESHRRYPEGTLHALDNSKVRIDWQDARAGLRIREDRYDLIITQPMYLKQAGSTFLNSREFMDIVRARLKPGGLFCLYSRGTEAQELVIRQTAGSVFGHGESCMDGYLLVLSGQPLDVGQEALERRFREYSGDPLWDEVADNAETASPAAVRSVLDHPRLVWSAWGLNLTDDDPLIEYPGILETRLEWARQAAR